MPLKLVLTLAIVLAGLAGRAAVDKALALRGGAELVAWWGQLFSVIELVAGVALAGVGTGLAVLVAQSSDPARQRRLLRGALAAGLAIAFPFALGVAVPEWNAVGISRGALVAGAFAGWMAIVPGTVGNFWLGRQHRGRLLALTAASSALTLAAAVAAPKEELLIALALSQAAPAMAVFFAFQGRTAFEKKEGETRPLRRYVLPGLAIGILSPASMLAARALVGDSLSWHGAGVLQALWRIQDWVASIAAGVMAVHYLPRLSTAHGTPAFGAELRRAALVTLVPSGIALAALAAVHRPLLAILYDGSFSAGDGAAALLFAGTFVRIASWIPLYALYAMHRTRAIAIGEFLSLPLFAAMLWAMRGALTLELAAAAWLAAYLAYAAFNFRAAASAARRVTS